MKQAEQPTKKALLLLIPALLLFAGCPEEKERVYTIGLFQVNEAPTLQEVRLGFLQALEDLGYRDGVNIRLKVRSAGGDISRVHRIARDFVEEGVDLIIALSTPCLQAALMAAPRTPIVFSSVANPYLVGAGHSAEDHLNHVTGMASTAPIQETLFFIREVLPRTRRLGTLYTPAELNSEFYLELMRQYAGAAGFEVVAIPVRNPNEVTAAAQSLVNKRIEAIAQISDNTINASFEILGRIAEENGIPLFDGFLRSTRLGACAALGWDFYRMGYITGEVAVRVRRGESPDRIPIQNMKDIKLSLNEGAAALQGVRFSPEVIQRADEVIAAPFPFSKNPG